ncbi:MAG: hypothetical protein RI883_1449 [Bacteroidota bacterium]|jgi:peptidoglycan/LPS O-acetylase OafA/YrhL
MNFFKLDQGHNRVFGLDLLRFIAIFMVLIGHSLIFVPHEYKIKAYGFLLDGVSIFFVLSGFLIGGILIKQLEKSKPNYAGLVEFWKRRWLRTLPAYLVVLLFLLIYTALVLPNNLPSDWYKFFFFIQNFFAERPGFFAEAWSLSIEEWFYLTIPFILFTVLYFTKSPVKWTVLIVSILVVIAITYFRVYLYQAYNFSGKEEDIEAFKNYMQLNIEYSVVPRLDSIMYGVIASFIAYYYPKIWQNKFNVLLFVIGIGILYYTKYNMGKSYLIYAAVWVSSLKSLGVFLMLPFLANLKNGGKITSFITYFSLISYSLYLVNLNVVVNVIIKNTINGTYSGKYIQNDYWYIDYILFWVFTIAISHTMYKLVEVPFINLRERKNIFKKTQN